MAGKPPRLSKDPVPHILTQGRENAERTSATHDATATRLMFAMPDLTTRDTANATAGTVTNNRQTTVGQRTFRRIGLSNDTKAGKIQVLTPAVSALSRQKYRRKKCVAPPSAVRLGFTQQQYRREDSGRNTSTRLKAEGADSDLVAGGHHLGHVHQ